MLGLLAAVEYGYMPSPRTGFYCNDPKINFKFNGDTVTIGTLLAGSFLGPLLVVSVRKQLGSGRGYRTFASPTSFTGAAGCGQAGPGHTAGAPPCVPRMFAPAVRGVAALFEAVAI